MLAQNEIDEWARGYIEAYERPDPSLGRDELSPYVDGLMPGSDLTEPDDVWKIVLAVLSLKPSDKVVSVLAAGPLEDLINEHGATYIERIEIEARGNPEFRHLLGGLWRCSNRDIWSRIEKARVGIAW